MKWEYLNKKQLQQFIDAPAFEKMPYIPITRHRAVSHINNPRADDDDILMILVWEENQLLGYLGLLPDYFFQNGDKIKVCWMTCIWVHPEARGMGLSKKMTLTAVEAYKEHVVLTEYTKQAGNIYKKLDFTELVTIKGIRIYNQSALHVLLPPKHAVFSKIRGILKLADDFFNLFAGMPIKSLHEPEGYKIEVVDEIDEEAEAFIKMHQYQHLARRQKEELNWMIMYPWILENESKDVSDKYAFSAYSKKFKFKNIKLRTSANELVAFLIISQRDEVLKLPYAYYREEAVPAVVQYLYNYIRKNGVSITTFYHPELVAYARKNIGSAIYSKNYNRCYLTTNKLKSKLNAISPAQIQDGDGDCAFT